MAKVKRSNNEMKKGATLSLMATLWAAADKLRHRNGRRRGQARRPGPHISEVY